MTTHAPTGAEGRIDPATRVGTVRLTVSELARAQAFYERVIGLTAVELDSGAVGLRAPGGEHSLRAPGGEHSLPAPGGEHSLRAPGGELLVELHADPAAPARPPRAPGLFHLALLMPSRRQLAFALARLAAARWPLDGASDHLVSEALYLSDPDGNGIEIYRDRPRSEWPRRDGVLQMATLPLDLDDVIGELRGVTELQAQAPADTAMGHVHLQVSELRETEAFYHGVLGFDVVVRTYPGALFVSAGGYHHHVGLNTWNSAGAPPPPPGAVGLRSFDVRLPDAAALERVLARVRAAGIAIEEAEAGWLVRDPSANGVLLRAAA